MKPEVKVVQCFIICCLVSAVAGKHCLCLQPFADQLASALVLLSPPDGSCRIMVVEQRGVINVFSKDGFRNPVPFLDISSKTFSGPSTGLIGLAFHPNFKRNRKFYIHYAVASAKPEVDHVARISEFKVKRRNRKRADLLSERVIIEVEQPFELDNGGQLLFDDKGYLLIFLGDGGGSGNRDNCVSQNRSELLGSVLRLDVNKACGYKIPEDNPFAGSDVFREEIYAYGFRNAYRADFDEGDPKTGKGRGRILIGEVGEDRFEEINILKKGGNYGWNSKEGFACFEQACKPCDQIESEVLPIHVYNHSVGLAVIGGHVYRGCMNPRWNGRYFFGDFVTGHLFQLKKMKKSWLAKDVPLCSQKTCDSKGLITKLGEGEFIMSFGEDYNGEVYVLTTSNPTPDDETLSGKVYKFIDPKNFGKKPRNCRTKCEV